MLKISKSLVIAQNSKKYLSFPDLIKHPQEPQNMFLVYREGDYHHPTVSRLILMESQNGGLKWKKKRVFSRTLQKDKGVWNCPRLSFLGDKLVIICDVKSSTFEKTASWSTYMIKQSDGRKFISNLTAIPGMVPDKIIRFKNKLFCANHRVKSVKNDLIQLISWSRDEGKTWYDTNIVAHSYKQQFCEASVVNMDNYLIAYLRDNSGHMKNIYYVVSEDGIIWSTPLKLPIYGQRVTAIRDGENVVGTYRDSENMRVGMFKHNSITGEIKRECFDWEYKNQQYHFGYTGLVKTCENSYIVANYIRQDEYKPFIKLSFIDNFSP